MSYAGWIRGSTPFIPFKAQTRMSSSVATAGAAFFNGAGSDGAAIDPLNEVNAVASLQGAKVNADVKVAPLLRNFVNGEWVEAVGGTMEVIDPSTGKISCYVGNSNAEDVEAAVQAAHAASKSWGATTQRYRADLLTKVSKMLLERLETLALCESYDAGKPVRLARIIDIPRAAENFDFFSNMLRTDSQAAHAMADAVNITQRSPVGVSALVTPWNLPLYLLTWKVAPCLACGNTIVVKASEMTPMTATALAEVLHEAGVPPGVFNLVHGSGATAGGPLVGHKLVRLVSFTGGTATGRIVAAAAAPSFKKVSLELGGKNPAIVFADANMDAAVEGVSRGFCLNSGQVCLCCPRLLLHSSIAEEFTRRIVEKAKALQVGDPLEAGTVNGPVISKDHQAKIQSYVDLAVQEGGRILCGGGPPKDINERCKGGFFFSPTVIDGLPHSSRVAQEEIFGPVCTVHTFETEEEAIALANDVEYGLASSVWTANGQRALRVSHAIHTGMVWVNCWMHRDLRVPFGGTKQSGLGHEGGPLSMDFYSEPKNICLKMM
jgi:aminomuconate-semialdehyde/2-hydroxymuconate-6-semialdehyde dehydrogenase